MKISRILLGLIVMSFSMATMAAPVTRFSGPFELKPDAVHASPIKGTLKLNFEADQIVQSEVAIDAAIYGKKAFPTTEIYYSEAQGTVLNNSVVFKLKGPSHKWFYVLIGTSTDAGKTYSQVWYMAHDTLANIQAVIQAGSATIPIVHGALNTPAFAPMYALTLTVHVVPQFNIGVTPCNPV